MTGVDAWRIYSILDLLLINMFNTPGVYRLRNVKTRTCLVAPSLDRTGGAIYAGKNELVYDGRDEWKIEETRQAGVWSIESNRFPGKYISARGSKRERWNLLGPDEVGAYIISSPQTNQVIEIREVGQDGSAKIRVSQPSDASSQRWFLELQPPPSKEGETIINSKPEETPQGGNQSPPNTSPSFRPILPDLVIRERPLSVATQDSSAVIIASPELLASAIPSTAPIAEISIADQSLLEEASGEEYPPTPFQESNNSIATASPPAREIDGQASDRNSETNLPQIDIPVASGDATMIVIHHGASEGTTVILPNPPMVVDRDGREEVEDSQLNIPQQTRGVEVLHTVFMQEAVEVEAAAGPANISIAAIQLMDEEPQSESGLFGTPKTMNTILAETTALPTKDTDAEIEGASKYIPTVTVDDAAQMKRVDHLNLPSKSLSIPKREVEPLTIPSQDVARAPNAGVTSVPPVTFYMGTVQAAGTSGSHETTAKDDLAHSSNTAQDHTLVVTQAKEVSAEIAQKWALLHEPPPGPGSRPPKVIEQEIFDTAAVEGEPIEAELAKVTEGRNNKSVPSSDPATYEPDSDSDSEDEGIILTFNEQEVAAFEEAADVAFPASDSESDFSD